MAESFWDDWMDQYIDDDMESQAQLVIAQRHKNRAEESSNTRGGSRPGRARNIDRNSAFHDKILYMDYWGQNPVYNEKYFKKHFKLPIQLFNKLLDELPQHNEFFTQRPDATGKLGASCRQKVAASMRMLTSGVSAHVIKL